MKEALTKTNSQIVPHSRVNFDWRILIDVLGPLDDGASLGLLHDDALDGIADDASANDRFLAHAAAWRKT